MFLQQNSVATALTVYGIETMDSADGEVIRYEELQQRLPFTVLKLHHHLPSSILQHPKGCNSAYRLRY